MTDVHDDDHITWREMLTRTALATGDRTTAKWLCEHASGCDGEEFAEILDEFVNARSGLHLDQMLGRLRAGEPLQYVMGRWAFRRLDLLVDGRVLIPRPETELLVEHVMAYLAHRPSHATIIDLGTGSGAIGLSLLMEMPLGAATVWMTDQSADAVDVARANAAGIGRPASGARFAVGSWFDALSEDLRGLVDVVVSNPPYIADGDPEVEVVVGEWEPHDALYSGGDGLDALREIVADAVGWLVTGGLLAVEIGHSQADSVRSLFEDASFVGVRVHEDLAGRQRFVTGLRPGR